MAFAFGSTSKCKFFGGNEVEMMMVHRFCRRFWAVHSQTLPKPSAMHAGSSRAKKYAFSCRKKVVKFPESRKNVVHEERASHQKSILRCTQNRQNFCRQQLQNGAKIIHFSMVPLILRCSFSKSAPAAGTPLTTTPEKNRSSEGRHKTCRVLKLRGQNTLKKP